MILYEGLSIDDERIRGVQGKTTCPNCAKIGKKNIKDTCLSVNKDKKLFNCHRCGWSGYYGEVTKETTKEYVKPNIGNLTALKDEHLQFFSRRGITQKTVIRNRIKSAKGDWIAFGYYEGEDIVNIKYRTSKEKKFMQAAQAKPTMYKYNDIVGQDKIIICEGEWDALSWEEAGFTFATSVNQGAPNSKDKNIEKKLECITNCFSIFEEAEIIYLSVDNDDNGKRLEKELIKMFGAEKCMIIEHGEGCKDANDDLLKKGKDFLKQAFDNAKHVKVDGIFEANDFKDEIFRAYRNGQPVGTSTYFPEIDKAWTWRKGEVNVWTGYNNEGKSLLLKQFMIAKSLGDGWRHGIFSPEEMPLSEWYTDVIESYVGKSADLNKKEYDNYMTEMQLEDGLKFTQNHFYSLLPEEDHTLDTLLKKFSYMIRKYGLDTVTFDPYNQIQHLMKHGEREDLYISRFMAIIKRFAVDHDICLNLVAHQKTPPVTKGENYPEPNLYSVRGGGIFSDKADNVLVVWRPNRNTDQKDTTVAFISQKIKKQKLTGKPQRVDIDYDYISNRYRDSYGNPFDNFKENPKQEEIKEYDVWSLDPNKDFEDSVPF